MNPTTKPIPLFGATDAAPVSDRLRGLPRFDAVQAATVAALIALRRASADDELSRPLDLTDLKAAFLGHDMGHSAAPSLRQRAGLTAVVEVPEVRTEAEPTLEYRWNKARSRVRAAAKAYSEQTHADY